MAHGRARMPHGRCTKRSAASSLSVPEWEPEVLQMDARRARDVTLEVRRRIAELTGTGLPVRLWDGTLLGDGHFRLMLEHPWSLRSLLLPPTELRAGEAYVFGDVDVEGDLVAALHAIADSREVALPLTDRLALARLLLRLPPPPRRDRQRRAHLRGRKHSLARDRAAIQFHYDLGNEFFRLFLDEQLVYSCAYFAAGSDDLDLAQQRKLDLICRKLELRPGQRLLDVGCGWGSLVIHAAREYGVTALGVTLSREQAALARQRVAAAGLDDRVTIELRDYRDVAGTFDAVASIGMFEHVGAAQLGSYFRRLHELTAPGGRLLNHGITTGQRQTERDLSGDRDSFVGAYVFPDGALVPAWRAVQELEQAGFEPVDLQQLRPHYARTLRAWVARLERHHDRAVALTSERDYRIWRAYMAGSAVGFERNDLGVIQVLGSKGGPVPLDRRHMEPRAMTRTVDFLIEEPSDA